MHPVFGGKVVEGEQLFAVFGQALASLGVLRFVGFQEQVESPVGILSRVGHVDVVQLLLRGRL